MTQIYVRVKNKIQLQTVLSYPQLSRVLIDHICADADPVLLKKEYPEKKFYLQLPAVLREKRAESVKLLAEKALDFDGAVIRTFDELGLMAEVLSGRKGSSKRELAKEGQLSKWQLIGDAFLYIYNTQAVSFYRNLFPDMKFLLPDELTDKELTSLTDSEEDYIYKAYGYQELMITAQCIRKNYTGCLKAEKEQPEPEVLSFTDDKKNRFFVLTDCGQCCCSIYNGRPTVMLDRIQPEKDGFFIDGRCFPNILLDFTMEAPEEVLRVLDCSLQGNPPVSELLSGLTRGHHSKGIE